ncbi:L-glyceraldehyde 3-phosphate reductase [Aestuariibaculum sediminum]|uniref:L-glyceraldehyde 3-phosphate reductase n=1 Tax=Aestuariibaculum sediminum TaxID=2770637 RepID=A0A8J6Q7S1_9FLAO|nr:L-glyceraldehyde 3-phosphate reductase [Aestuariibaculum sediminum]MBD0831995.1 L-glyceraldehyde 3-phosphate reductase [Aestuariibaculum sediminum]
MQINDKSENKAYFANEQRYSNMTYNRTGKSGVLLPALSLGLWHNFGFIDNIQNGREILRTAFDLGITHFDLANNYGPPYGSAEENFGTILKTDFKSYRDELFIATKAGYDMWPGPYGNLGSRKYLIASLDQSLKRMALDYVDIFYHHRPDPETPLEETMGALADIVRQGKALYVGISNYKPKETAEAAKILKNLNVPFILHQARYSMFDRWVEDGLLNTLNENGVGCIAFSPLAQGILTDKYIKGIPENSRASKSLTYLNTETVNENLNKIQALNALAESRGQKLSQMAIAWILRQPQVASVLIGASSANQLKENVKALDYLSFTNEELLQIENIIK